MIRLSVLYPTTDGAEFDHTYYQESHVPLLVATWNPVRTEIDRGVSGPYVAAVHAWWNSTDDMNAALASEGTGALMLDVANYTTITSILQISDVV